MTHKALAEEATQELVDGGLLGTPFRSGCCAMDVQVIIERALDKLAAQMREQPRSYQVCPHCGQELELP